MLGVLDINQYGSLKVVIEEGRKGGFLTKWQDLEFPGPDARAGEFKQFGCFYLEIKEYLKSDPEVDIVNARGVGYKLVWQFEGCDLGREKV